MFHFNYHSIVMIQNVLTQILQSFLIYILSSHAFTRIFFNRNSVYIIPKWTSFEHLVCTNKQIQQISGPSSTDYISIIWLHLYMYLSPPSYYKHPSIKGQIFPQISFGCAAHYKLASSIYPNIMAKITLSMTATRKVSRTWKTWVCWIQI